MAETKDQRKAFVDWLTVAAIGLFWVSLVAMALNSSRLPAAVVVIALAVLGGFYMSLQHEVIHGHPTHSSQFNRLLVGAPLGMVQPFARYRATHLAHHGSDLTEPGDDPESYYVLPAEWARAGAAHRALLRANRTLAVRLTVGPVLAAWQMLRFDRRRFRHDANIRAAWIAHIPATGAVIVAIRASGLPLWMYLLGFVYGGASLTSMRSFVEHRAHAGAPRSAIVRSNWFFSLLYLNNNLHYTHHQLPGVAWFRLPEMTEVLEAETAVADGAGVYPGYFSIVRRYFLRPFDLPVYPLSEAIKA